VLASFNIRSLTGWPYSAACIKRAASITDSISLAAASAQRTLQSGGHCCAGFGQQHRLLSRQFSKALRLRPPRQVAAAAGPETPYQNTAQLRQIGLVLGVADYKDLQRLIR